MELGQGAVESVVMSAAFWRGRSVLVTGHTGFKGGWLCLWLKGMGARVTGYSLPAATPPNLFEVAGVADGIQSLIHDVRDFATLRDAVAASRPQVVFHLAAQPLVRRSYEDPRETYETNVMGTVNVLEAIRQVGGVRAIVIVTSDKCYENREWLWGYRENEPMGGHDPYSNSKGCAELVTAAFRSSYFNPADHSRHGVGVASARAGNVVGGGDWSQDRLIPDMIRAFHAGKSAGIRSPDSIRPWQHVLEPLQGYLSLAERLYESGPEFSSAWNFGPGDEESKTVSWVADQLLRLWEGGTPWHVESGPKVYEASYLKLDSSKAHSLLGWRPRLMLGQALESLVDWHKAYSARQDMKGFTMRQIEKYAKL